MEVASYLASKASGVAVVGTGTYPYERSLGPEIGKMCMQVRNTDGRSLTPSLTQCDFYSMEQTLKHSFSFKMLEEKSVKFYMNDGLTEIKGENGKVALMLLLKCLPETYCVPTV